MFAFPIPVGDFNPYAHYRPVPAITSQATVAEGGPLPCFGASGTGGIEGVHFVMTRNGYSPFVIRKIETPSQQDTDSYFKDLMREVQTGFGRTMNHLPGVFGVSRQTLYNWINGETPKEQHQAKIVQLATAARAFAAAGYKPTARSLDRTIAQGKTFLELMGEGADGHQTAQRLIRIDRRGAVAREKLDVLLGDRLSSPFELADMGSPGLNEDV